MKIKSINIQNFKSIKDVTIPLQCYGNGENASNTTFLVGINECGKSAILEAISLINKGFKDIEYDDYCNFDAQEGSDNYIDIYTKLEITDHDFWKKLIEEELEFPKELVDNLVIKSIEKHTYSTADGANEQFNIEINDDLPFYQYIVNKTRKTVGGQAQTIETIEDLADFNGVDVKITKQNAKAFLTETQTLLTKEKLEQKISFLLKATFNKSMPKIQIWKPDSRYLINETIDLNDFKEDPSISVPLKNIFSICGKSTNDEIKSAIERALGSQAKCDKLKKEMSDAVTKYINKIWKEHKIKINISINSTNCEVHVEDKDKRYTYFSMAQRSDGFKQFISLILSLSAQNQNKSLKNNIILIDEPEVHLHPSGIRYMRDELLKIGKNNHVVVATHSNFMVDTDAPERHWVVQKEKAETKILQVNEDFNFADDKVLAMAFGLNLIKELLPKNIIVVEGLDDKNVLAHAFRLFAKNFYHSIKDVGGASKVDNLAKLLSGESIKPFVVLDADKEGKDCKKRLLDMQKDFYSASNVFTLKDILPSLPDNSTIEDLLPIDFVKDFISSKMKVELQLDETKALIPQIRQSPTLKDKQQLDSLKIKLSEKFCADFKTEKKIETLSRLKEFVESLCSKIEEFNVE